MSALSFIAPRPARDDRRECPRLPLSRILATFQGGHFAIGHGDVSTGGALWVGSTSHATSELLEVTFHLEDAPQPLHLLARVVGREESHGEVALHLQFVDPPFEAERRIARYVDGCLQRLARSA